MSTPRMLSVADRTAELRGLLPLMISRKLGRECRVRSAQLRASAYRSSFALEEIDLFLQRGEFLQLILKDLGAHSLLAGAELAKPDFLRDPLREIEFYRHVLANRPNLRTAELYSTVVEPSRDRYWLLLERVPGVPLSQIGDFEVWRAVARWLARLHSELAPLAAAPPGPGTARLLRHDRDFLRRWLGRATAFVCGNLDAVPSHLRRSMKRVAMGYELVIERVTSLPTTIIHGEFYPSNVLVQGAGPSPRVCPVDWEMVALGPGLLDLAALVSGDWTDAQRREIALAYYAALPTTGPARSRENEFFEELDFCRLHVAVQWLGWSERWSPPPDHQHDWLSDAVDLAERLEL